MNIFKKIYCRTFQFLFKIAGPVLPYRDPKILYKIDEVYKILNDNKLKKPIIITDKTICSLGLTKSLEQSLTEHSTEYILFDKTVPNPTSEIVEAAVEVYNNNKCDCIIAFGGGSPMDCAKALGARIARPKKTLSQLSGLLKIHSRLPVIIAIPTTAGTGSETTPTAVITDSKTRHKYTMNDFVLIPRYAVLDPHIISSVPKHISSTVGIDVLTHAVEAYIGNSTFKQSRKDAEDAAKLVFENIEKSVILGDIDAQRQMLIAAHKAGRAFSRSYVGYIHAVSHSLSGKYDMPHGLANAVILPNVLEKYGNKIYKKLARLARCANIGGINDNDEELALKFIKAIKDLNARLEIPEKLQGIKVEDITEMAKYADKEANPLYPVPILWNAKEIEQIYYDVME